MCSISYARRTSALVLKLVGIGQDTFRGSALMSVGRNNFAITTSFGLIEVIESKDPEQIVVTTVRLAVGIFTLSCQCFTGDTLVSTEDGDRRIDEIKPGDKVWSYNIETGENELQEVKNVSVSKTDVLVHVTTTDVNDIKTTMFHPFYIKNEDGTGEWKAASNLEAGDELLTEDGSKVLVSEVKVEKLDNEVTVYNLELGDVHTYFVAGGVLVHNGCGYTKTNNETGHESTLAVYDSEIAAKQLLVRGETSEELLRSIIPQGIPNTFIPTDTIRYGYKYNFSINGKKIEIKWHSQDLNAAMKYPGSNSGSGWTAQIKVGNKLLTQVGSFVKKPQNYTHIPLKGGV